MKGIYYILNINNRKSYIGSSKDIDKRLQQHNDDLNHNRHCNILLQRSWNNGTGLKFIFGLLEELPNRLSRIELLAVEQQYLDLNTNGYNLAPAAGGDIISNHPNKEEICKKISKTLKKKIALMSLSERKDKFGHPGQDNPRYIDGRSYKKMICPVCEIVLIKLDSVSCSKCNKKGKLNPFYNRHHTPKTKQILRDYAMNRKHTEETKDKLRGEKSSRFQGYYHTPWGVFASSSLAQKMHDYLLSNTINNWCKNSHKKITRLGNSRYLKELSDSCIGKTYNEIGFSFEPM